MEEEQHLRVAGNSAWAVGVAGRAVSPDLFSCSGASRRVLEFGLLSAFANLEGLRLTSSLLLVPSLFLSSSHVYTIPTTHSPDADLSTNPLIPALLKAKSTPIDRFIPDEMKETAMFARVKALMLKDWRGEGKKVVKDGGFKDER